MKFSLTGNLVDIANRQIYAAEVTVVGGRIGNITRIDSADAYLMPAKKRGS